jgi:hypothetical protein
MDETHFMNSLNSENTFSNIETRYIFGECVVLDEHGHQIASREELHYQVKVNGILKRVEQLDDPRRVRFGQDVSFCSYVCKLRMNEMQVSMK